MATIPETIFLFESGGLPDRISAFMDLVPRFASAEYGLKPAAGDTVTLKDKTRTAARPRGMTHETGGGTAMPAQVFQGMTAAPPDEYFSQAAGSHAVGLYGCFRETGTAPDDLSRCTRPLTGDNDDNAARSGRILHKAAPVYRNRTVKAATDMLGGERNIYRFSEGANEKPGGNEEETVYERAPARSGSESGFAEERDAGRYMDYEDIYHYIGQRLSESIACSAEGV
jgi:hypothetical protein